MEKKESAGKQYSGQQHVFAYSCKQAEGFQVFCRLFWLYGREDKKDID